MRIDDLLDKYEVEVAAAFRRSIAKITSRTQVKKIEAALRAGDADRALDLIYLNEEAFREFERALQDAFTDSGELAMSEQVLRDSEGQRFQLWFQARNRRAERRMMELSSQLITNIVEEQRRVVRQVLTSGLQRGDNPRTTSLDLVGRVNRKTGKREGSIIGLSEPQLRAMERARAELEEGNFSAYRTRKLRDRTFDRLIKRAEREDRPLSKSEVEKVLTRYRARLLKHRGDTIGRTETLSTLHAAQHEAVAQLIADGRIREDQVTLEWDAARDGRTRVTHLFAHKQKVRWGEKFRVGRRLMMYPGDPAGGPEEVINCRCALRVKINYLKGLK